jgi:hypothetical protein
MVNANDSQPKKSADETEPAPVYDDASLVAQVQDWIRNQAPWWATSFMLHMFALSMLLLIGRAIVSTPKDDAPTFDAADVQPAPAEPDLAPIPLNDPPPDQGMISPDVLLLPNNPPGAPDGHPEIHTDTAPGGAGTPQGPASAIPGFNPPGIGAGPRMSFDKVPGTGGSGGSGTNLFGPRDRKLRPRGTGETVYTERSVQAALSWLYRHQMREGNWSLRDFEKRCTDKSCTGTASEESLCAATAMGVLPFLAAGQTHQNGVPRYRQAVFAALYWLVNHQAADGDLSAGATAQMYSHALGSIALCEAYGMTKDRTFGAAAQRSINFIQAAQNSKSGGWRYHPGEEGDTSVVGWQLMALKSAQAAGLTVSPVALDGTKRWLLLVSKNGAGGSSAAVGNGQFAYQPDGAPTPTMSAVGLLCNQYLHVGRADPVIVGGVRYLMANAPDEGGRNMYYWYYATQVMHNMLDKDWDAWNRKMRDILVHEQIGAGCATGSWDPDRPTRDAWGAQGGRLMMTSFATLTLEVYYRYLSVYQNDQPDPFGGNRAPAAKALKNVKAAGK